MPGSMSSSKKIKVYSYKTQVFMLNLSCDDLCRLVTGPTLLRYGLGRPSFTQVWDEEEKEWVADIQMMGEGTNRLGGSGGNSGGHLQRSPPGGTNKHGLP